MVNLEANENYTRNLLYQQRLVNEPTTNCLQLTDFSFQEVKSILTEKFKVHEEHLPRGLGETVFKLSGGNPFWVREISL